MEKGYGIFEVNETFSLKGVGVGLIFFVTLHVLCFLPCRCVINTFLKKYMIYFCNICCNIFIFHLFIFETALYLKSLYFHFYFCEIRAKLFSRTCTYANFTSISNFILYRYFAVSEILFRQCKLCCSLFNFIYCIYYFVGYVVSFILK